jgi:mRNA-degrading endonuclease toxin of MazEF toxin-antitoxin module
MNAFDIHIAFVSWGNEGKRRPVLVLEEYTDNAKVFSITTRYEEKSEAIRERYFEINDWQEAGLQKPSYIDTNSTVTLPLTAIDGSRSIGRLSDADESRLIEFVSR